MDVFVSYRRVGGSGWANFLYSELTKRGIEVFLDREKMKNGKFPKQISENIRSAPNFLLLLTPGALDKRDDEIDWMRKEIATVVCGSSKKNIIVVCLEGFNISEIDDNDVHYIVGLKKENVIFFRDDNERHIRDSIFDIIDAMVDEEGKQLLADKMKE